MLYWTELKKLFLPSFKTVKYRNEKYIGDLPMSFDIETSSFFVRDGKSISNEQYKKAVRENPKIDLEFQKVGLCYIWQFSIGLEYTFYGRHLYEFVEFLQILHRKIGERRAIIFVHNLSFEFQFIYKLFDWVEVFALDNRKVMFARTALFDFRCSYLLSAKSLSAVSKEIKGDYPEYSKKDGDLDYKLIRHSETPLTEKELGYCEYDTLTVNAYIYTQIKIYKSITKIPFTNTGRVRRLCRQRCFAEKYYAPMIHRLNVTPLEFKMSRFAFQGGYVHGNPLYVGKACENVASYDFTSSYPYVMMSEKYPMGKGFIYPHKRISQKVFERYCTDHLAIVAIEMSDVKVKDGLMPIISSSKCLSLKGCKYDNGKVWSAQSLSLVATNVEYENLKKFYDIGKIVLGQAIFYKADYLPKPYIETIIELYSAKTKLKDYKGKTEEETLEVEREYMLKKNMLNSLYGMMVYNPIKDEYIFDDDEWKCEKIEIDDEHTQAMNDDRQRFTFYLWGVFVTTYARNNLYGALLECKDDFIYSDTDSVKIFNHERHKKYFDDYDKTVVEKLLKMCKTYDIDFDECQPKNIKGKRKLLGIWDYEGQYEKFKTLGAKRYMTVKDGELDLTVSGVNKRNALPYLIEKYKTVDSVVSHFDHNLYLPSEFTGKSIHSYIDEEIGGLVTDYKGNEIPFKSLSSVHLIESDYNLSILEDFRNFFRFIQQKHC